MRSQKSLEWNYNLHLKTGRLFVFPNPQRSKMEEKFFIDLIGLTTVNDNNYFSTKWKKAFMDLIGILTTVQPFLQKNLYWLDRPYNRKRLFFYKMKKSLYWPDRPYIPKRFINWPDSVWWPPFFRPRDRRKWPRWPSSEWRLLLKLKMFQSDSFRWTEIFRNLTWNI